MTPTKEEVKALVERYTKSPTVIDLAHPADAHIAEDACTLASALAAAEEELAAVKKVESIESVRDALQIADDAPHEPWRQHNMDPKWPNALRVLAAAYRNKRDTLRETDAKLKALIRGESSDPNGTIWECAAAEKSRADLLSTRLDEATGKIKDLEQRLSTKGRELEIAQIEINTLRSRKREKILREALEEVPCTCRLSDNGPDAKTVLCDPCKALVECYGEGAAR